MVRILAIETSCDETAMAILEGEGERVQIMSSMIRSQIGTHSAYGGVVPEVGAREHLELFFPMLHKMVPQDGVGIDAIAVTAGPGLAPALRVGVEAAKGLAYGWKKPLVPVCHLEGHIYASWLRDDGVVPAFPALALIVSGGHTELVLMRGHGEFERLGETLDDAAGEAFDKVAKMLDLGYPGGPKVAALAEGGNREAFAFPRAMMKNDDSMFSFSGLKTAVLYTLRQSEDKIGDPQFRADVAASFEEAVVDVLVKKTMRAAEKVNSASIILAGGVAANLHLRSTLAAACAEREIPFFMPEFKYSMDNAAMIAVAGYFRHQRGDTKDPRDVIADPNMDIA